MVSVSSEESEASVVAAVSSESPDLPDDAAADEPWAWSSAAERARTGAGFSGSSAPSFCTSIQRTTSLLEYVWIALKTMSSAFSGRAPKETGNCWMKPGSMPLSSAVQVTLETASEICRPCTSRGLASLLLVTVIFQPSTFCGITEESGASAGKLTSSWVVEALSRSFGTRKLTRA